MPRGWHIGATLCHDALVRVRSRYDVLSRLGAGGGGDLYVVSDTLAEQGRMVMKVLPDVADAQVADGLRREFAVLASLADPRLARVFDFGALPAGIRLLPLDPPFDRAEGAQARGPAPPGRDASFEKRERLRS